MIDSLLQSKLAGFLNEIFEVNYILSSANNLRYSACQKWALVTLK